MLAITVKLASRPDPFKIVLRWEVNFVVATVALVSQFAFVVEKLECLGVVDGFANLEHQIEVRSLFKEPLKASVFVVFVKREKILLKCAVKQSVERLLVHRSFTKLEHPKYVGNFCDGF